MAEDLTDRGAAHRVRFGMDWKYALSMELDDAGFDASILSEFRTRLVTHLQHVFSAVALNLIRLDAWWNDHPLDRTRTSHLARLDHALVA